MSLNKTLLGQVYDKGTLNEIGIVTYSFTTSKFIYTFKIMEGAYIAPFLMVNVKCTDEDAWSNEMISAPFMNLKSMIRLLQGIKQNELKN